MIAPSLPPRASDSSQEGDNSVHLYKADQPYHAELEKFKCKCGGHC